MSNFEHTFSETEDAAASTIKSASKLISQAKALQQAAKKGKISAIKNAQQKLKDALETLSGEVADAVQAWMFKEEEEEQYLGNQYVFELLEHAKTRNLKIYERSNQLIIPPSVVRILPDDRAVMVGKKKLYDLRPSYLADLLLQSQEKPVRYNSKAFLESLYNVYSCIASSDSNQLEMRSGYVVPLEIIYKLMTSLPGSSRSYDRTDFARDLYLLDTEGPNSTRKGATVHFTTSTGARRGEGVFSFCGQDGQDVQYYGIRFDRKK